MGRRKLKSGDRVKVTGPWLPNAVEYGKKRTGEYATVIRVDKDDTELPLEIQIDGVEHLLWWCRENVRALPRRKQ